jgi:hypothetical protein
MICAEETLRKCSRILPLSLQRLFAIEIIALSPRYRMLDYLLKFDIITV